MESGLIGILLGTILLIGLGMIPGLALIRILDPGADQLRQMDASSSNQFAGPVWLGGMACRDSWKALARSPDSMHLIGQHTLCNLGLAT